MCSFKALLCELSLLLAQIAELQRHNEDLIQEMDRVRTELESGKPKKKPYDAEDPSKV